MWKVSLCFFFLPIKMFSNDENILDDILLQHHKNVYKYLRHLSALL